MKKDFIKDEGRIRNCDSNLAKMNLIEFAYCYVFHWGYFKKVFGYIWECMNEFLKYGFGIIYNTTVLLLTPITLLLCGFFQIKNAKKRILEDR